MNESTIIMNDFEVLIKYLKTRLSGTAIREVIQAASGFKVSRISMSLNHLPWISSILESHKISFCISNFSFLPVMHNKNSNWISKLERCDDNLKDPHVSKSIYIGSSKEIVELARYYEEINDDNNFGKLLGIPECCRDFYNRNLQNASKTHNDFTIYSSGVSEKFVFGNMWCNIFGQYFGYALLSFSPCSFQCDKAITIAKNSYELLYTINLELANRMKYYCTYSGLYSIHEGIALFKYNTVFDDIISYNNSNILSYNISDILGNSLKEGNFFKKSNSDSIEIMNKNKIKIYSNEGRIMLFGNFENN
jgi:hypothetical protein